MNYMTTSGAHYCAPYYDHVYRPPCNCAGYWWNGWYQQCNCRCRCSPCNPVPQTVTIKIEHVYKLPEPQKPKTLTKRKSSREW